MVYFISKDLLYIPPRLTQLKIIQMRHNLPVAGYFGLKKTMELISRDVETCEGIYTSV